MLRAINIIFSSLLLVLMVIGEDILLPKGKNIFIPIGVKKSATKWHIYPIIKPEYIGYSPQFLHIF